MCIRDRQCARHWRSGWFRAMRSSVRQSRKGQGWCRPGWPACRSPIDDAMQLRPESFIHSLQRNHSPWLVGVLCCRSPAFRHPFSHYAAIRGQRSIEPRSLQDATPRNWRRRRWQRSERRAREPGRQAIDFEQAPSSRPTARRKRAKRRCMAFHEWGFLPTMREGIPNYLFLKHKKYILCLI